MEPGTYIYEGRIIDELGQSVGPVAFEINEDQTVTVVGRQTVPLEQIHPEYLDNMTPLDEDIWHVWPDGELQRWEEMSAVELALTCTFSGPVRNGKAEAIGQLTGRQWPDAVEMVRSYWEDWLTTTAWEISREEDVPVARDTLRVRATIHRENEVQEMIDSIKYTDSKNYDGWTPGDVLSYLERFGEVVCTEFQHATTWDVAKGGLFYCFVTWSDSRTGNYPWNINVRFFGETRDYGHAENRGFDDLIEGMEWAIETWREAVRHSTPTTEGRDDESDFEAFEETHPARRRDRHQNGGDGPGY